jgi:hypothetical protein
MVLFLSVVKISVWSLFDTMRTYSRQRRENHVGGKRSRVRETLDPRGNPSKEDLRMRMDVWRYLEGAVCKQAMF